MTGQGSNAIAIGKNAVAGNQAAGSIAINAGASNIAATQTGFYAHPIRNDNAVTAAICYNTTTNELTYSTSGTKTFVIDHPTDAEKYLVHACLEGPEAGVYYRGEGVIEAGKGVMRVELPAYATALATDFTVQVTAIMGDTDVGVRSYAAGRVVDGAFTVYGSPGEFFWQVVGRRATVEVEPRKADVAVRGEGPYRYIL
jgi:hypothetical protein